MDRPCIDFLVAGVQKGGTTALHDYLREHPDLGLPAEKELHHFDDGAVDWSAPDHAGYHAKFDGLSGRAALGEATPIYTYWPDSLERVARYNPAMRLVVLFRDPIRRAWSHWRMERARGFDDAPFAWAIREGRARVAQAPHRAHRVFSYVERGFYAGQLERLYSLFPRDQLLLLSSQDLDARPEATLARVHAFLGVAPRPPAAPHRANVGASAPAGERMTADDVALLRALYAEDVAAFGVRSGLDVGGWLGG